MGVLGAVYGASDRASAIVEEKQEKWGDSTAHLSPGLAGVAGRRGSRGKNERTRTGKEEGEKARIQCEHVAANQFGLIQLVFTFASIHAQCSARILPNLGVIEGLSCVIGLLGR